MNSFKSILAFLPVLIIISCNKDTTKPDTADNRFKAGIIDSVKYCYTAYNNLIIESADNLPDNGYYSYGDSIDIDKDGTMDIGFHIDGITSSFNNGMTYFEYFATPPL